MVPTNLEDLAKVRERMSDGLLVVLDGWSPTSRRLSVNREMRIDVNLEGNG